MLKDSNIQTAKAKEVLKSQREALIQRHGAKSIGVGYKTENGKVTDKVALIFYVEKKNKKELLTEGIAPIPEKIEGIPTDVVAIPGGFKARLR